MKKREIWNAGGPAVLEEDLDSESMAQMYEASFRNIEEGAVVRGRVVKVTPEGVMIDIGYKSEGIVPIDQFQREELERLAPGAEVEIFIEDREDSEGNVLLSKEKAEKIKVWESIARASEQGEVVEGRVVSRIKGDSRSTWAASRRSCPAPRSICGRSGTSTS